MRLRMVGCKPEMAGVLDRGPSQIRDIVDTVRKRCHATHTHPYEDRFQTILPNRDGPRIELLTRHSRRKRRAPGGQPQGDHGDRRPPGHVDSHPSDTPTET